MRFFLIYFALFCNMLLYNQHLAVAYKTMPAQQSRLSVSNHIVVKLLRYHRIFVLTPKIVEVLRTMLTINNKVLLIEYLAGALSADSSDIQVRNAYDIFYQPNGLAKITSWQDIHTNINLYSVPPTIAHAIHAQDRVSLYKLVTTVRENVQIITLIKQGIQYIIESCNNGVSFQAYSNLGRAIADAVYYRRTEAMSLIPLGDYTRYCHDAILKENVITFVSQAVDKLLYKDLSDTDKAPLQQALSVIDTLWCGVTERNDKKCATILASIFLDPQRIVQEASNYQQDMQLYKHNVEQSKQEYSRNCTRLEIVKGYSAALKFFQLAMRVKNKDNILDSYPMPYSNFLPSYERSVLKFMFPIRNSLYV